MLIRQSQAFHRSHQMNGLTLIEVMLVLAIVTMIMLLGVRQYAGWRLKVDMLSVKTNVDMLFGAAAQFYRANCGRAGSILTGSSNIRTVQPIAISDLTTDSYLSSDAILPNVLVKEEDNSGYIVQFNPYTMQRTQLTCKNPPACTQTILKAIGTIVLWRIQVAVAMQNTDKMELYKNYLMADCVSHLDGTTVTPCTGEASSASDDYLVFERLPSDVTEKYQSVFWPMNSLLGQFNQMYSTYPINYVLGVSHAPEYQYFYCST